jgi:hydroxyethylthiazole kinase
VNDLVQAAVRTLERVRREQPLIHIITNFVTMNDVANATLAIGARPVMAHALEEIEEITSQARALVLNLGTPSRERMDVMQRAAHVANAHDIPILFDPVGIGASAFRRKWTTRWLDSTRVAIVRGNAGEIGALAGMAGTQSGVDTLRAEYDQSTTTKSLAQKYRAIVVITGATDFVSDGARAVVVENGHPFLKQITGAGDMLDALIAAGTPVESDRLLAATCGLVWLGVAAERAAREAHGIGSFRVALFDALSNLDAATIQREGRLEFFPSLP